MNRIDLHTHSSYSDGALTPKELILLAKEKNLSALALTDHDTIEGLEEAEQAALQQGIEFVPGIEMVADYFGVEIHIVGLFIDKTSEKLLTMLETLKYDRIIRNKEFVKRLKELGIDIDYEALEQKNPKQIITKAHFNNELIKAGYCKSFRDAMKRFFGKNCYTNVIKARYKPSVIIETIKAANGIAIMAHPLLYNFEWDDLHTMIKNLTEQGIDGMECMYGAYSDEQQEKLIKTANEFSLAVSGGSDFHSSKRKPQIDLAVGGGNLLVPYTVLDNLKSLVRTNH